MLLSKTAIVKYHNQTKKHYMSKGYDIDNLRNNDTFEVKVEDLTSSAEVDVQLQCDYCGEEYASTYKQHNRLNTNGVIHKDCCGKTECMKQKRQESNLLKHGYEYTLQIPEIKDKIKNTNIDKYGVEIPSKNKEVTNKIKQTHINKYGDYFTRTDEYKEKYYNTCQNKYGYYSANCDPNVIEKMHNSNLKKYGTIYPMQVKEICEKAIINQRKTLYQNGTTMRSIQQIYVHQLIGGEINYPYYKASLDIAFPEEKLYIEYDGGGHRLSIKLNELSEEQFNQKERRRWYSLYNNNWKEIRIISINDYLPSDKVILEMINYAKNYLNTDHSWIIFDIDNQLVKCSQFENTYDFGELRKIKNII